MPDLTVITVSHNASAFLGPALRSVHAHAEGLDLQVLLVDNGDDGAGERIAREFPWVTPIRCPNRGFAYGNNAALKVATAPYVLFLNPDTEVLKGQFSSLLRRMEERPDIGLAGVNQVRPDGKRLATIRRFPSPMRTFADGLGARKLARIAGWIGSDVLDPVAYGRESTCDWVSGSFLLARKEVLASAGWFDERFFLYFEETDLCLRVHQAGFEVRHLPIMTVLHHQGRNKDIPRFEAQIVLSAQQYGAKHFSLPRRVAFRAAILSKYALRVASQVPIRPPGDSRRESAVAGMRMALGNAPPPFLAPQESALRASAYRARSNGNGSGNGHRVAFASTESADSYALNLTFHGIGEPVRPVDSAERGTWVTRRVFEELIDWAAGRDDVHVTFDDGNRSDLEIALPALVKRDLRATFFPVVGRTGEPGFLTRDDILALVDAGMSIGSHGMAHRSWRGLEGKALEREIGDARTQLEDIAQIPVTLGACPFGQYDRRVLNALKAAGFTQVFTSDGGRTRPTTWLQARNTVLDETRADHLEQLLEHPPAMSRMRKGGSLVKRWR